MSTRKNTSQRRKSHTKIDGLDGRYLIKAFGICLITFVVGIFIGKKLTPPDNVQDLKKQIEQTDPQDKFTFFYTLPDQKPTTASQQRPRLHTSPSRSPKKNAPLHSKNHTPKNNYAPSQKSSSLQDSLTPDGEKYTIQIGAFRTKNQAEQLSQTLKNKGYPTFLNKADLGNKGVWYRVRVGRFSSLPETKNQLRKLSEKTGLKGFVAKTK